METNNYTREQEILNGLAVVMEKINQVLKVLGSKETEAYEGLVGVVECDEYGNLHVEDCQVGYKYCQDMIGKTVRLSLVTGNINKLSSARYPMFAKRVAVVE